MFLAKAREFAMRLRSVVVTCVLAVGALAPAPASAGLDDMLEFLSGGAPIGRSPYSLFNMNAIRRTKVNFPGNHKPGTIVINTAERRLYLVNGDGTAIRYGIGVGRVGFTWKGVRKVTEKREWPDWTPPPQMLKRRPDLPRYMPGGIDNPLGARAMYLGGTLYRIHGSNEPETIGQAVSSGCFRLTNDDVKDLYDRVKIGTTVIVQ
jgi:lipoprotein-anchoring transpeptidase ErfK/SrfK